jgi:hypothetical protein
MEPPELTDLACVIHVHSNHSDGTGTVAEIAQAAAHAGVDVVLLTDHDTLAARAAGEERRHGSVLMCVGEEVSPAGGNHYLAFGLERPIQHAGLTPQQIVDAVRAAGGFGFLSHPFSRGGSGRFARVFKGMPWSDLEVEGYTGLELWSFVTDTVEGVGSVADALRFVAAPGRVVDHPPPGNVSAWDELAARRRVVAIGGLDAHQVGRRIAGRVPLRLMAYRRSFSYLRTHVLVAESTGRDAARDRAAVYTALREGRCYLAMDSLAPARGFRLWAVGSQHVEQGAEAPADERLMLHVRLPRAALLTVRRNGVAVAEHHGAAFDLPVPTAGVYRVEASLPAHGRMRTWIISNPLYLR